MDWIILGVIILVSVMLGRWLTKDNDVQSEESGGLIASVGLFHSGRFYAGRRHHKETEIILWGLDGEDFIDSDKRAEVEETNYV